MRLLYALLLLVAMCDDAPTGSRTPRPSEDVTGKIAFTNVNVVSVDDGRVLNNHTVYVENGFIRQVGPASAVVVPDSAFVIDAKGLYLMPGLADCHTHIYYETDLLPFIANGVTAVLNMGSPPSVLSFREKIGNGELIGPHIYASAFVDGAGRNGWIIKTPEEVHENVAQIASMKWDFIKVYSSLKKDVFVELVSEAEKYDLNVIGHGVRDAGLAFSVNNGQVMIAHAEEFIYTIFNNSLDESKIPEAVQVIQNSGAYVTPNLSAFEAIANQSGSPATFDQLMAQPHMQYVGDQWINQWRNSNRFINSTLNLKPHYAFLQKLTRQLHAAGVPLLLGTDAPFVPTVAPGFSIHDDLRTLVDAGLSPVDAIRTGTITADNFFKQYSTNYKPSGQVKVDYRADLVLLSRNPLDQISNTKSIEGVMVNGRWLSSARLNELLQSLK